MHHTLCCPACHAPFGAVEHAADDVERWPCTGCGRRYPVRFGIPDLRLDGASDPYLTVDEDLRAAERLARRAESADFTGVLAAYYEANTSVPASQAARFTAGTLAARGRADAVLGAWQAMSRCRPGDLVFVDAGCGTGPLGVAAASGGFRTLAIDVGLRWLVLAAARARDASVRLTTACAHAAHLPLAPATADIVASEYLIENLVPAAPFLAEAQRVLGPEGHFWCTTANRYTPAPDPHLGVPFAGWWPDAAVRAWAGFRHALPPVRHLFTAGSLRRALAESGFTDVRVEPAPVSRDQRAGASALVRRAIDVYQRVGRSAAGRRLLIAVGPSFVVTARNTPT